MFPHVVTFLLIFLPSGPPASAHASASGDLTVTAVVASSASLTFDSDGKPVVVVANAPADANAIELASTQFAQTKGIQIRSPAKRLPIDPKVEVKEPNMLPAVESPGFSALLVANAVQAGMVKRILQSHGFDVLHLPNAPAASQLPKQRRFDLGVYDEEVRGALELADYSNNSLHRVAIGLLAEGRTSSAGARLHFVMRKPLNVELLDKAVKAAFAPIAADRRASFRHEANIENALCRLHHLEGLHDLHGVTIVNLSLTGLCVQTREMLPQHSRIEFVLPFPHPYGRVHLFGRVVWSHSSGRSGVRFTYVDASNQRNLEDWADSMYRG
jgi:hypothetical protein